MIFDNGDLLLSLNSLGSVVQRLVEGLSSLVHPLNHVLDLPGPHWLESITGLVKSSGFDDAEQVTAAVSVTVGIPIGVRRKLDPDKRIPSRRQSVHADDGEPKPVISDSSASTFGTVVPRTMFLFLVLDILSIVLVRQSLLNPCTSKLFIAQWMIGGILMGFPATWLVDSVRVEYSFRSAFVLELIFLAISFLWLCFGGARIFNVVSACVDTIAPLWWLSYVSSVLSLSLAGTVIFGMIVTTVLSLIYGSTAK
jgi:hypothetical protein